jgi:hypothetical protein
MIRNRLAANFNPMIQPSAALAAILPSAVDVFGFHDFSSFYSPSFISFHFTVQFSLANYACPLHHPPKNCTTGQHAKLMPTPLPRE